MDIDLINETIAEDKVYQSWVREQKNRILNMSNTVKKQDMWNKLFPKTTQDDSYLTHNIF